MFQRPENRKKHILTYLCLAVILLSVHLPEVGAAVAKEPVVCLTDQNAFVYYKDRNKTDTCGELSLAGFAGMAPGEERTQVIHLKNESAHTVRFFVAQETLKAFEEENQAAGGAYRFQLSVGEQKDHAKSLLDTKAGGYDSSGNKSENGLAEIDELQEETFLAKVEKGKSVQLFVTLKLEGEGNDNRTDCDYSEAVARIGMRFLAKDATKDVLYGDTKEVVTYKTRIRNTVQTALVKTSDRAPYGVVLWLFVSGVAFVVAAGKKRKGKAKE